MHRLIAIAVLLFWAVIFGGLAHLSLSGLLNGTPEGASEFQLLMSFSGGLQIMPVLLMVVAAMFGWAILALLVSDNEAFREVEVYSFASAIFLMCACAALAFTKQDALMLTPAVLTAALATCAAASRYLQTAQKSETVVDHGREIARRMALGAAHNSLLSRVSGRQTSGQTYARNNVTAFPAKPLSGDQG